MIYSGGNAMKTSMDFRGEGTFAGALEVPAKEVATLVEGREAALGVSGICMICVGILNYICSS